MPPLDLSQGNASLGDINSQLKYGVQNTGQIAIALQSLLTLLPSVFPQVLAFTGGTFTLAGSASTTVAQPLTAANSFIFVFPTNAAGGTLQGSAKSLYVSARTANTSFTVSTASGVAAAGTEAYLYILVNL